MDEKPVDIQVGEWVCVSEDGLWPSAFTSLYSWETKKGAIEDIRDAKMDAARKPRVKRQAPGEYRYYPKSCDTKHYGNSYLVVKLTEENIDKYREMMNRAE